MSCYCKGMHMPSIWRSLHDLRGGRQVTQDPKEHRNDIFTTDRIKVNTFDFHIVLILNIKRSRD